MLGERRDRKRVVKPTVCVSSKRSLTSLDLIVFSSGRLRMQPPSFFALFSPAFCAGWGGRFRFGRQSFWGKMRGIQSPSLYRYVSSSSGSP
jgi:hypothetical protein